MQITVSRGELDAAITWAARGVSRRPVVPILAGLQLTVSDGKLSVAGFDYDNVTRSVVTGDDATAGTILVNGAELAAAVKAMPKSKTARAELTVTYPEAPETDPVSHEYIETPDDKYDHLVTGQCGCGEWKTSGSMKSFVARGMHASHAPATKPDPVPTLALSCDGVTSQLAGMPDDEYPALPELPELAGTFAGDSFARAFTRVAAAAGRDDTLPVLTRVQVQLAEASVTFAATDRYRLAYDVADWTPAQIGAEPREVFMPAKIAGQFVKAAKTAGKIALHYRPGEGTLDASVALVTDDRQLIMRSMAHYQFPRWSALVRADDASAATVTADAKQLGDVVARIGKMCARSMPIRLAFTSGTVTVDTVSPDTGEVASSQTMPAEMSGDVASIGLAAFNHEYLGSMLAGYAGVVALDFASSGKPVQLRAEGDSFRAVCMPIRLS